MSDRIPGYAPDGLNAARIHPETVAEPASSDRAIAVAASHHAGRIVAPMPVRQNALDREVRKLMTPGVVSIAEDASLTQVLRALASHRVHALVVIGQHSGRPLGWVTVTGLLAWLDGDPAMARARDAITEPTIGIEPSSTGRDALSALTQPGVSHLLVQRTPTALPEGVVSALDLVAGNCD
jgi:CBS domain-containing protein